MQAIACAPPSGEQNTLDLIACQSYTVRATNVFALTYPMRFSLFILLIPGVLAAGQSAKRTIADLDEPLGLDLSKIPLTAEPTSLAWSLQPTISAGMGLTRVGRIQFSGGSYASGVSYPSFVGSNSLVEPPIGTTGVIAPRIYNDGFVGLDPGTINDNRTWNWGYQGPGQAGTDTLTFHASGAQSIRSDVPTVSPPLHQSETSISGQVHLNLHLMPLRTDNRPGIQTGFLLSLSALGFEDQFKFSDFSLLQARDDFRIDYTDIFQLAGVVPPSAPYAGTATGPGPVIPNMPDSRSATPVPINRTEATLRNQVHSSFEASIVSLGVGPAWRYHSSKTLSWEFAAGLSLNVYDWSANQQETVTVTGGLEPVRSWSNSRTGSDINWGLFVRGAIQHQLSESWSIALLFQAHTIEDLSFGPGPSNVELENDGFTIGWNAGLSF